MKRQDLLDRTAHLLAQAESPLLDQRHPLGARHPDAGLHQEQLLEDQPLVRRRESPVERLHLPRALRAAFGAEHREVEPLERQAARHQAQLPARAARQGIAGVGRKSGDDAVEDLAQHAAAHLSELPVDRRHAPGMDRRDRLLVDDFAFGAGEGQHAAPVLFTPDLAVEDQPHPRLIGAAQVRLVEELDQGLAGGVAHDDLDDREPAPLRLEAAHPDDCPQRERPLPLPEGRQRDVARAVLVAKRRVLDQVRHRPYSVLRKLLGAPRPDALDVLDRSIEPQDTMGGPGRIASIDLHPAGLYRRIAYFANEWLIRITCGFDA